MLKTIHPWMWRWITPLGLIIFSVLFLGATYVYPGGSQADPLAPGFSWQHNYWCNLTNLNALNGEYNPARWIAIPGLWVLSISLLFFLFLCSHKLAPSRRQARIMYVLTCCTVLCLVGIYSRWHDWLSVFASIFGLLLIVQLLTYIRKWGFQWEFHVGAILLAMLVLNALIYFSQVGLKVLPVLQKVTFFPILIWVFVMHRKLVHMPNKGNFPI